MSYRRRRGFGILQYSDLLAQANLQRCDPMDSACVSDNVAKEAAVEDFWAAHQSTGVPDNTKLTFTPQTPAQVQEFYNPTNLVTGGNVVDTRGIMQVAGVPVSWTQNSPAAPAPAVTKPPAAAPQVIAGSPAGPAAPPPGTPGGSQVVSSSGAVPPAPALPAGYSPILSTVFLGIPVWGWAAAAGVALFAFGGGRGR